MSDSNSNGQAIAAIITAIAALIGAIAGIKACNPDPTPQTIAIDEKENSVALINPFCAQIQSGISTDSTLDFYAGYEHQKANDSYHELILKVDDCIPSWTRRIEDHISNGDYSYYFTEFSNGHDIVSVNWLFFEEDKRFTVNIDFDVE